MKLHYEICDSHVCNHHERHVIATQPVSVHHLCFLLSFEVHRDQNPDYLRVLQRSWIFSRCSWLEIFNLGLVQKEPKPQIGAICSSPTILADRKLDDLG